MKTSISKFLVSSLILCLSISVAIAQQAKKISVQGFLKDANGKAVADGSQSITFKLYNVATGGTAAWTDNQTINIFGGVYSAHLGSVANPVDGLNWGSETYFVGVTVQGTELIPRTELTFAPYSLGSPKSQEVVCSGAVGDVKYSILNPTQFAAVNGSCWVPMDGRALATTDKLRTITGLTTLPNAGGLFLRGQEFSNSSDYDQDRNSNSTIAQVQSENFASHTHSASLSFSGNTGTDGNHRHNNRLNGGATGVGGWKEPNDSWSPSILGMRVTNRGQGDLQWIQELMDFAGSHSHTFSGAVSGNTNNSGGNETRPDNLNLWTYIRVN